MRKENEEGSVLAIQDRVWRGDRYQRDTKYTFSSPFRCYGEPSSGYQSSLISLHYIHRPISGNGASLTCLRCDTSIDFPPFNSISKSSHFKSPSYRCFEVSLPSPLCISHILASIAIFIESLLNHGSPEDRPHSHSSLQNPTHPKPSLPRPDRHS